MLPGLKKHDPRGSGEGIPTDLRGKLTESQLRKSKNLAKKRRQKVRKKSKDGSAKVQSTANVTNLAKRRLQKVRTKIKMKKQHWARPCESDIWQNSAKATETEANRLP